MKRSATTRKSHQLKRRAILVLGMHRSGTSALSGVACALGASAPNTPLPANFANPSGYWESWPLVQAHDELLASADSAWDDWRGLDPRWYVSDAAQRFRGRLQETIRSEYDQKPLFVVKDPRICRFLPFFLSVLKDMSVAPVALFPIRNPLEVASSLRRRDGFSVSKSVALWLRHVLEAEFHSRQFPRCFISYENLLKDWRLEMDRASDTTGIKWPVDPESSAASIEKFLTADLYHERTESAALENHPDLLFLAAETFHLLGEASRVGADPDLFGRIDAVREKFDEASNFFGEILRNEERSIQQLRATLNQKSSELERRRESIEEQKNHQLALMIEEQKNYRQGLIEDQKNFRQALIEEQKNFQEASIEEQKKYQLALIAEQTRYQQTSAEEQNMHQQAAKEAQDRHQHALKEVQDKHQQASKEAQDKHQHALKEAQDKHQQASKEAQDKHKQALKEAQDQHQHVLKEVQDKHQHALKEVQDKHQQALEEQKKYRLALIAEQEKHQQVSAEEQNRHEKALKDAQSKHQQELRHYERERDEYVVRLNTLSAQLAELNDRYGKNEARLNFMIKELTDLFDRKRSEHAHVLADLESSKNTLDDVWKSLAVSRDVGERQANKLQEIEARHRELQADVGRKEAAIDDLNREIALHKKQIENLHALLVDSGQQNQALNSEIDAHRTDVENLHGLLVERDYQNQAVMAQIEALYASRSWRMTRPIRATMRFFSKH